MGAIQNQAFTRFIGDRLDEPVFLYTFRCLPKLPCETSTDLFLLLDSTPHVVPLADRVMGALCYNPSFSYSYIIQKKAIPVLLHRNGSCSLNHDCVSQQPYSSEREQKELFSKRSLLIETEALQLSEKNSVDSVE